MRLNGASISYTPESSGALGFGFRCGFLGLLHGDREGAPRSEFALALIATAPSVEYRVRQTDGEIVLVDNPADLPDPQKIDYVEEPYFRVSIITPKEYTGPLMDLCQTRRGEMKKMEYLSPKRVQLDYEVPLAEVVVDFFDQMKSRTQGCEPRLRARRLCRSNLVKVDLLLNGVVADAFSTIVHRDKSFDYGRRMCEKLRELIRGRCSTCRSRPRSAARSSPARRCGPSARTSPPSATAATSPASASCSRSRRKARRR